MQRRNERGPYLQTLPPGSGNLMKRPPPFRKIALSEIDHDEEHGQLDVPSLPTTKLSSRLANRGAAARPDFALTPQDYQQIDDQIEEDLDLSNMSTVNLMQLS